MTSGQDLLSPGAAPATSTAAGRLLQTIFEGGAMSRAEATARTGLSRSAAGTAVDDLERLGLIETASSRRDGPGRPSVTLTTPSTCVSVVTVELQKDRVRVADLALDGTLSEVAELSLDVAGQPAEATLDRVGAVLDERIAARQDVLHVGAALSVPGLVRRTAGVVTLSLPLRWRQVPVAEQLRRRVSAQVPLHVGQDALFAAIAEHVLGAGSEAARMLLLTSGRLGLGGAIVGAGRDRVGADHSLQAGHVVVDPGGERCICGARGCLEAYADGRMIGQILGLGRPADQLDLTSAVDAGLPASTRRILAERVIGPLSVGLVSLVNTLGPDRVVLAGLLGPLHREFEGELAEALAGSVVADADGASVHSSALHENVLVGAGCTAFTDLFADPVGLHRRLLPA